MTFHRTTGDEGYLIAAADAFDTIAQQHVPATGTFDDMTVYTVENVTDIRFDSAGAMHASNEMIWLHSDEVNGFPVI